MMHRLSALWTAAIAYVALAVGAGLSIMYNVLQTVTVRGPALETADLVTAVAMPGIVVLMVEIFVSRMWVGRPWYMQTVRVVATVAIGGVAMRASWTHGHDWMVGHGHTADVATLWPLAIDLLAIMATALILASRRGHKNDLEDGGHVVATDPENVVANMATLQAELATEDAVATLPQRRPPWMDELATEMATADLVATRPAGDYAAWEAGYERAIDELGQDLATETERFLAKGTHVPVVPGPTTTKRPSVPSGVEGYLRAWDPIESGLSGKDVDTLLAAHLGRSERTARRWRMTILGGPVSGPPSP
jgi:hypothetical protein